MISVETSCVYASKTYNFSAIEMYTWNNKMSSLCVHSIDFPILLIHLFLFVDIVFNLFFGAINFLHSILIVLKHCFLVWETFNALMFSCVACIFQHVSCSRYVDRHKHSVIYSGFYWYRRILFYAYRFNAYTSRYEYFHSLVLLTYVLLISVISENGDILSRISISKLHQNYFLFLGIFSTIELVGIQFAIFNSISASGEENMKNILR